MLHSRSGMKSLSPSRRRSTNLALINRDCPALPTRLEIDFADGNTETLRKVTNRKVPAGRRRRVYLGGGGGYGAP
jgi:hypothetical protein